MFLTLSDCDQFEGNVIIPWNPIHDRTHDPMSASKNLEISSKATVGSLALKKQNVNDVEKVSLKSSE